MREHATAVVVVSGLFMLPWFARDLLELSQALLQVLNEATQYTINV
jgi:hypothetical protein